MALEKNALCFIYIYIFFIVRLYKLLNNAKGKSLFLITIRLFAGKDIIIALVFTMCNCAFTKQSLYNIYKTSYKYPDNK